MRRKRIIRKPDKTESFLSNINEAIIHSPVTNAVCFLKHENGEVSVITTEGNIIETLGIVEYGKNVLSSDIWEDD